MPIFETSVKLTKSQEQLATILLPVLVMLGGIGLSYAIYMALKWFTCLRRRSTGGVVRLDTEAGTPPGMQQSEVNHPVIEVMEVNSAQPSIRMPYGIVSGSSPLQEKDTLQPPLPTHPLRLGREAILARKEIRIKKNASNTANSKRVSLNSGKVDRQLAKARLLAPSNKTSLPVPARRSTKGKENKHARSPSCPCPPLKNGYKPLVLGTIPIVAPRVPETAVHPTHGYRYF
ncbi:hypothetical protein AX17_004708 [Amanita inopinata Kibby_2008]|nr:hypothetical protein AX17_004708 [Amanita inopinata Kibby_2008]